MTTHDDLLNELNQRRDEINQGGGATRIEAQHAKGKRTARERLACLLDEGTFHEIDPYMTHRHSYFGMDQSRHPGDSVVAGFGKIDGRKVAVYAQDFTVLGGSFSEVQGQKVAKIMDLALCGGLLFTLSKNCHSGSRFPLGLPTIDLGTLWQLRESISHGPPRIFIPRILPLCR